MNEEIRLVIDQKEILDELYIPYIKNGGFFLPHPQPNYSIGETLKIELHLYNEPQPFHITTCIILVPPQQWHDPLIKGVGVEFSEQDQDLRNKIEMLLAN